jgi:hypothetical protein
MKEQSLKGKEVSLQITHSAIKMTEELELSLHSILTFKSEGTKR